MSLATMGRKSRTTNPRFKRDKCFTLNMTNRGHNKGMKSNSQCIGGCKKGGVSTCCAGDKLVSKQCRKGCGCWYKGSSQPAPQVSYNIYLNNLSNASYRPGGGVCCSNLQDLSYNKSVIKKLHSDDCSVALQRKKDRIMWFQNTFNTNYKYPADISGCPVKKSFNKGSTDLVRYNRINEQWCGITKSLHFNNSEFVVNSARAAAVCPCEFWITHSTTFHSSSENTMFNMGLSHHIDVVHSGTGLGNPGAGSIGTVNGPNGLQGFKSNNYPEPTSQYAALSLSGNAYPIPYVSMRDNNEAHRTLLQLPNGTSLYGWETGAGRYLHSKTLCEMNLTRKVGSATLCVTSWSQLVEMTVYWISGNNDNGGDRPDVKPIYGSLLPPNDFRTSEDLGVEFFNVNYGPVGTPRVLFAPKREPTAAEVATAAAQSISQYDTTAFNNPLKIYNSKQFTTTTIKAAEFGSLKGADFFVIGQPRHTHILDNYGIKYVSLKFKLTI